MQTSQTEPEHYSKQLAAKGMRLAAPNESGWFVTVWALGNDRTVNVWATDESEA